MDKLEERVRSDAARIIGEKGWRAFSDLSVNIVKDAELPFAAFIDPRDWRIHLIAAEDFYEEASRVAQEMGKATKTTIESPGGLVMDFLLSHEHGHFEWCPRNHELFKMLIAVAYREIEDTEYRMERIVALCAQVHNEFADTVLNVVNSHDPVSGERYRQGFDLAYLLMSKYQERHEKRNRRHSKEFTLFSETQKALAQTSPEVAKMMARYEPRFFLSLARHRRKLLSVFTGDEESARAFDQYQATAEQRSELTSRLKDPRLWPEMMAAYTRIIYPYMREGSQDADSPFTRKSSGGKEGERAGGSRPYEQKKGGKPQPSSQSQGGEQQQGPQQEQQQGSQQEQQGPQQGPSGTQKRKDEKKEGIGGDDGEDAPEKKSTKDRKNDPGGNGGREETQEKQKKQDSHAKNSSVRDVIEGLLGNETADGSSPWLSQLPLLDRLYKERAEALHWRITDENSPAEGLVILAGREEATPEMIGKPGMQWGRTVLVRRDDGSRAIQLYRKHLPIELDLPGPERRPGLPDLAWVIDGSLSMRFDPIHGRGEYHLASLGVYATIDNAERLGIAPLLNYNIITFSKHTRASGWCSYRDLEKAKRRLFDYEGDMTLLDPSALRELRLTRRDNCLLFMLSDTEFNSEENAHNVMQELKEMRDSGGIGLLLFQLGKSSRFSREAEQNGIPVKPISDVNDFVDLTLRYTDELYRAEVSS